MALSQLPTSAQPTDSTAPIKTTSMSDDPALLNFDSLPNLAHVRINVVIALYACSRATVWRHVKAGRIPAPIKLSERTTVWQVSSLRKHLMELHSA